MLVKTTATGSKGNNYALVSGEKFFSWSAVCQQKKC